jgi:hypothetical protein
VLFANHSGDRSLVNQHEVLGEGRPTYDVR